MTLRELAGRIGGRLKSGTTADRVVAGVSTLEEAGPDEVCYFGNPRYRSKLATTRALAVICTSEDTQTSASDLILVKDAYSSFREALLLFQPDRSSAMLGGAGPGSAVHPSARVHPSVRLGRFAVIDRDCVVGENTMIGHCCCLGPGVIVGSDCTLGHNVVLEAGTRLGDRVILHSGTVLGSDGFGFVPDPSGARKVPQNGNVVVLDDVEIGANCAIDRGTAGDTVIGPGTKLDNLVHLAHNVRLGSSCMLAAQVGMAGSTRVGDRVMFGGQAGITGHIGIGDDAVIGAQAGVTKDVRGGTTVSGYPARPHEKARRIEAVVSMLPEILDRLRRLEGLARPISHESGTDESEADDTR
ncbi:UDP-3-O-(3-hydroxymyristoyl)glucosamine N-acyltransferase [Candidatus Fermentibacterales bacterium]|nr:UDP-3-O-(3-hydroxymyristoyl)glucosamine N-acyltransferase [Candidatus Fermentibacterales bacterium]